MLPLRTILIPTDFSEGSDYALRLACSLARHFDARLVVLHVVPPPIVGYGEGVIPPNPQSFRETAQSQLSRLELPDPRVRVERWLEDGEPATEIRRVANEIDADVIIMGTHGRTGLGRLLMGSVAEEVMRKAPCPVLTAKTPATVSPSKRLPRREVVHA